MIATGPERRAVYSRCRHFNETPGIRSEAACRELVWRIVHAPTFARSERLGTLLTYVCDLALQGREEEITEQKIGQAVFGRPLDYDSSVDGIVRSQASRLRQRLDLYYQGEGADELVRIVIPRGRYIPMFEAQAEPAILLTDAGPSEAVNEAVPWVSPEIKDLQVRMSVLTRWLPWGLNLFLALMLVGLWAHNRRTSVPVSAVPRNGVFWGHIFTKNLPTMVVAPDSGLVLYHNMSGRDVGLREYLDARYRSESNGPSQIGPTALRKDWLFDVANRRYTSMVDLEAILLLKERARTQESEVSVRYARDLRPNDFKGGTVILLGAAAANPWIELFEHNMNFLLRDDYTKYYSVINRSPQNSEPTQWEAVRNDPQRRVFGLVAYMPGLTGDRNALILEGTSMSGTEAATDFVADDTQLLPFLDRIRRPDGTLPHFEVLLMTQNIGASAGRSQILAWRTMT